MKSVNRNRKFGLISLSRKDQRRFIGFIDDYYDCYQIEPDFTNEYHIAYLK